MVLFSVNFELSFFLGFLIMSSYFFYMVSLFYMVVFCVAFNSYSALPC